MAAKTSPMPAAYAGAMRIKSSCHTTLCSAWIALLTKRTRSFRAQEAKNGHRRSSLRGATTSPSPIALTGSDFHPITTTMRYPLHHAWSSTDATIALVSESKRLSTDVETTAPQVLRNLSIELAFGDPSITHQLRESEPIVLV